MRGKWGNLARTAAVVLVAVGATGSGSTASAEPPPYRSEVYSHVENWICHAGSADFCDSGHDATAVSADGTLTVEPWRAATRPPVDCFYLYPTTSHDPAMYSDRQWTMEDEGGSTWAQVARFGSQCRVFAPVYRSFTLAGLFTRLPPPGTPLDPSVVDLDHQVLATPYADVLDAWRHYLANENHGRGVILLGHSQGSLLLKRLIQEEIDPDPRVRDKLVSAFLIGATVQVPVGKAVGGDFEHVPVCRVPWQTGCVVTYGSYRAGVPLVPFGAVGRDQGDGLEAACTNPAALLGGKRYLRPYLARVLAEIESPLGVGPSGPWVDPALGTVTTPWVSLPRMIEGECVGRDGHHFLEITQHGDPADPRVDDVGGDLKVPIVPPGVIGLHFYDYAYALGDMQRLALFQSFAHLLGL